MVDTSIKSFPTFGDGELVPRGVDQGLWRVAPGHQAPVGRGVRREDGDEERDAAHPGGGPEEERVEHLPPAEAADDVLKDVVDVLLLRLHDCD